MGYEYFGMKVFAQIEDDGGEDEVDGKIVDTD